MVVSGLLIKLPYWIAYQLRRLTGKLDGAVFYVHYEQDFFVMENILPYIEFPYTIAASSRKVAGELRKNGLQVKTWPVFPEVLIMARHTFHRFPVRAIKKIGLKHGTYHFKKMISAKKYNAFDLYFFATDEEVEMAAMKGINCGVAGGTPVIDKLFDPKTLAKSLEIKKKPGFDKTKPTILFTTTWDKSGLSAIDKWIDSLAGLKSKYNILVSLHPMMSQHYLNRVKNIPGIYISDPHTLPAFMLAADFLISDTSSIMGEFCALDKPIITFAVEQKGRLTGEIQQLIGEISLQISDINQLDDAINKYMNDKNFRRKERCHWREIFYGDLGISHGKKTALEINAFIAKHMQKADNQA